MTAFSLLPPEAQLLLAGLLFLSAEGQLALCLYQAFCRADPVRRTSDGALLAAHLLCCAYLTAASRAPSYPAPFACLALPPTAALSLWHTVAGMRREYRRSRERLSPASIRQSLDDLNTGILFADSTGRVVLLNNTMIRLASVLTGGYPQMLHELDRGLADSAAPLGGAPPLYRLADGRVWRFQTIPLTAPELAGFTQTTAQDVTELADVNERLRQENGALDRTNAWLRRMYDRLADRIREQETLNLKMRIHNDIGSSLIAISELMRGGPQDDMDAQLRRLREAVSYLSTVQPVWPDTFESVRRQAAEMRVTLELDGALPQEKTAVRLIVSAARECVTNCVRHARGDTVTVRVTGRGEDGCTVVITNNGEPPDGPVTEGSGLSTLRKSVEITGGNMYVVCEPRYALILNLPEREQEP